MQRPPAVPPPTRRPPAATQDDDAFGDDPFGTAGAEGASKPASFDDAFGFDGELEGEEAQGGASRSDFPVAL